MGYNSGMVKYIIFAPIARPMNFFKYGGGYVALESGINTLESAGSVTPDVLLRAYVAYLSTKYLPPTTLADLLIPIIVGAVLAGLAWRVNVV